MSRNKTLAVAEEGLRLLDDSVWYLKWSLAFDVTALIILIFGITEAIQGKKTHSYFCHWDG